MEFVNLDRDYRKQITGNEYLLLYKIFQKLCGHYWVFELIWRQENVELKIDIVSILIYQNYVITMEFVKLCRHLENVLLEILFYQNRIMSQFSSENVIAFCFTELILLHFLSFSSIPTPSPPTFPPFSLIICALTGCLIFCFLKSNYR